jgi:hypothetical protein
MSRPWSSFTFLPTESVGDGLDRLLSEVVPSGLVERGYQYRLIWDSERLMWRVDRRVNAPGG